MEIKNSVVTGKRRDRGDVYIKINNYTYLFTPQRSELSQSLNLKRGDIVVVKIEKVVRKHV